MVSEINSTIELSPELTNLAYELGLNAPKICEGVLKLASNRLQGLDFKLQRWTRPDLKPRHPRCQRGDHPFDLVKGIWF
jgi:hypothetical protein